MIQIISGVKGKGKTKFLIQKANEAVKAANGSVVYLDKNNKHMYELSNRIRLINVGDFPIDTYDAFIGFICGLISQDRDLEHMFFDSFLTIVRKLSKNICSRSLSCEIRPQINPINASYVSIGKSPTLIKRMRLLNSYICLLFLSR